MVFHKDVEANGYVIPGSEHHMRVTAPERLRLTFDDGKWLDVALPEVPVDPLKFRDEKRYVDRLKDARAKTGAQDAFKIGYGRVKGLPMTLAAQDFHFMGGSLGMAAGEAFVKGAETALEKKTPYVADAAIVVAGSIETLPIVLAVMDYRFMGGSMGSVVGEKLTRAAEFARERKRPLVIVSASGGARMQEGILSLMQLPRTTVAVRRLRAAGLPYFVVLTNPTTGGVTASYAMLGDIHIAEPGALIGFAGPRVIEQTIREKLPEGFQRSEYLKDHGMVDMVVHRREIPETLARLGRLLTKQPPVKEEVAVAARPVVEAV